MASIKKINLGTDANSGDGTPLRDGGRDINDNFEAINKELAEKLNKEGISSETIEFADGKFKVSAAFVKRVSDLEEAIKLKANISIPAGGVGSVQLMLNTSTGGGTNDHLLNQMVAGAALRYPKIYATINGGTTGIGAERRLALDFDHGTIPVGTWRCLSVWVPGWDRTVNGLAIYRREA